MNLALLIVSVLAAYIFGYWHGKTAQRTLNLNLQKAVPKIGTSLRIDKRQSDSRAFPPFYYLIATIYNAGELAVKELNGQCRLYSPTNEIKESVIPIERDFLGSSRAIRATRAKAFRNFS